MGNPKFFCMSDKQLISHIATLTTGSDDHREACEELYNRQNCR